MQNSLYGRTEQLELQCATLLLQLLLMMMMIHSEQSCKQM